MRTNRLVCMIVATAMMVSAAVTRAADYKDGDKGTFTGKLLEKGTTWIRVKNSDGTSEKFIPRWIGGLPKDGGGPEKEMVEKLTGLKEGDKVEIQWEFSEHLRVVGVKVLE